MENVVEIVTQFVQENAEYTFTMALGTAVHLFNIYVLGWTHKGLDEPNVSSWMFVLSLLNFLANVTVRITTERENPRSSLFAQAADGGEPSTAMEFLRVFKHGLVCVAKVLLVNYVLAFMWIPINEHLIKLCQLTAIKINKELCTPKTKYMYPRIVANILQYKVFPMMRFTLTLAIMSRLNNFHEKVAFFYRVHGKPFVEQLGLTIEDRLTDAAELMKEEITGMVETVKAEVLVAKTVSKTVATSPPVTRITPKQRMAKRKAESIKAKPSPLEKLLESACRNIGGGAGTEIEE